MTELLEKAIDKIRILPDTEQDVMAALILEEFLDEQEWNAAFSRSQDKLAMMAEKVRRDISAGRITCKL